MRRDGAALFMGDDGRFSKQAGGQFTFRRRRRHSRPKPETSASTGDGSGTADSDATAPAPTCPETWVARKLLRSPLRAELVLVAATPPASPPMTLFAK